MPIRSSIPLLFAAALALTAASCASKDAVAVSGSVGTVQLNVKKTGFVTAVSGHFDVSLELGARAAGPTDVTFTEFSLVRIADGTPVLAGERLSVLASLPPPVHLEPGSSALVSFEIGDLRNNAVVPMETDQADYASVCGAGELRVVGSINDTTAGTTSTTPLKSAPFLPSGC